MSSPKKIEPESRLASRTFPTTQWSVVLKAGAQDVTLAAAALERLCSNYWNPVYAFIRFRGQSQHDAEDTTQAFFAFLLEKESLKKVDRKKGRFRSFLLAALKNFLSNQWDKQKVLKRGGSCQIISMDDAGEAEFVSEVLDRSSPEQFFERQWAVAVVERALTRLKLDYSGGDRAKVFAKLQPELTREPNPELYASWAEELGLTEGALQVALHRLRRRFGELLCSEIAHTVASPEEVKDEIRYLFASISN